MRIRGERECTDCGHRWTYYETGSVECPDCGSVRSVGVGERTQHTDGAVELDLTPARSLLDDDAIDRVAERAADLAGEYVRRRGFIDAGDLRRLDDRYLAAAELTHVADRLRRAMRPDDETEYHLLELLRLADEGDRPDPADVPQSLRAPRGLAYADAVRTYRREIGDWDGADRETIRGDLDRLETHARRIRTLDGDVSPRIAETLVSAARALGDYCRTNAEATLVRARDRLDHLDSKDRLE
jgi:uncharacterized Zn finger protein (UPF0148 family)